MQYLLSILFSLQIFFANLPDGDKFIDPRDGNVYTIVVIDNTTWLAENLRYKGDINLSSIKTSTKPLIYLPNNKEENLATYGYLYNYSAAQKACPDGWHLPTTSEWKELKLSLNNQAVGSKLATNAQAWNNGVLERSSNFSITGFNVLPAGNFDGKNANFASFAYFWTNTEYEYYNGNAYYFYIFYNYDGIVQNNTSKVVGMSVRCVKNK